MQEYQHTAWGYCRVSSRDQNEGRQIISMRNNSIDDAHIYIDKNLLGTFTSDLVIQIPSFVAQSERENIRNRQRADIDAALARVSNLSADQYQYRIILK